MATSMTFVYCSQRRWKAPLMRCDLRGRLNLSWSSSTYKFQLTYSVATPSRVARPEAKQHRFCKVIEARKDFDIDLRIVHARLFPASNRCVSRNTEKQTCNHALHAYRFLLSTLVESYLTSTEATALRRNRLIQDSLFATCYPFFLSSARFLINRRCRRILRILARQSRHPSLHSIAG